MIATIIFGLALFISITLITRVVDYMVVKEGMNIRVHVILVTILWTLFYYFV